MTFLSTHKCTLCFTYRLLLECLCIILATKVNNVAIGKHVQYRFIFAELLIAGKVKRSACIYLPDSRQQAARARCFVIVYTYKIYTIFFSRTGSTKIVSDIVGWYIAFLTICGGHIFYGLP